MMRWAAVAILGACGSLWAAQRYAASAIVLKVDRQHKTFVASCQEIPGYMEAMTMPIPVRDVRLLDGLRPGAVVDFKLIVTAKDAYAGELTIHHFESTEREPFQASGLELLQNFGKTDGARRQLQAGEAVPDFTLTDQAGQRVSLSQFSGKVVVAAFFYASCPLPNYCFRLSNNLGRLKRRFGDRLGREVVLLSITIDPEHDTPEVLAKYAATWKADARSWHFLTGPDAEVAALSHRFGVNSSPDDGRLTHSLHTIVIDRQGKLAANFEGNEFSAEQLGDFVAATMQ